MHPVFITTPHKERAMPQRPTIAPLQATGAGSSLWTSAASDPAARLSLSRDRPWDLVTLGEALVEFNQTHGGQPQYLQGFGGDTSNAAIAAARAGASTACLTRLGQDGFGDALLALWQREGVDSGAVERDTQHPTGVYFVTHGAQGHQFSYLRSGSAASRMSAAWVGQGEPLHRLRNCRMLLVSGISLAISPQACDAAFAAMRIAREAGACVAFDPNLRLRLWPRDRAAACIAHAISLCDLFLPGLEDMAALLDLAPDQATPEHIAQWSHARGAFTVVLKLGAQGAWVSTARGLQGRLPGRPAPRGGGPGAGDCFDGNLLARLALGDTLTEAARYANAASALAVQGHGAVAPLPHPQQVLAALA
jgi:2-dehydro-3-deoxygluconokinase